MDLESECSVLESVEDNEEIVSGSVSEYLENSGESKPQNNGSCVVGNNDNSELFPQVNEYVSSPSINMEPQVSPLSTSTKKGNGLRKWRRIARDSNRHRDSSVDTNRMVAHNLNNSGANANPSKRMQYADRKQKSEGSVSSTNAVVRSMDDFALPDDSGLGLGPPFATGTDSENSEDQSSKSSTAASAPKLKNEIPMFMGSPRDRGMMRSLSGKNLAHPVQRGRQGKSRTESTKKAKGEWVKIKKENSHSSMESDSRSFNFVFMQGTYPLNNGIQNDRPNDYDDENSEGAMGSGQEVNDGNGGGYSKDGEGGYGDSSPVAGSSLEAKKERSTNHCTMTEQDPLDESLFALHSAQEAIRKELLMFKEIGNSISVDDSITDLCTEFTDEETKNHKTRSDQSQGGEGPQSLSQSEVIETAIGDEMRELEDLYKQKVETDVVCLAISRTVHNLKAAAVNQIAVIEEQKALASEQTQILDKLVDVENRAAVLKKETEKLDKVCEDIGSADEILKLQKRVGKYSSCVLLQLVLFLVILAILASQFMPSRVELAPT